MKTTTAQDKAFATFAELMIEKIQTIKNDWHRPWFTAKASIPPRNVSGRDYNGGNTFFLMLQAEKMGYELPVWGTFDKWAALNKPADKENGVPAISVQKGEKAFPVFLTCFTCINRETKEKIRHDDFVKLPTEQKEKFDIYPKLVVYYVFNIAQTNIKTDRPEMYADFKKQCGVRDNDAECSENTSHPAIDAMIDNNLFLCPIKQVRGNEAFYSISKDEITIPERKQFEDGEAFASNTLHECAHATGAAKRLGRLKPASFASKEYAREELIAEMTAAIVCSRYGMQKHLKEDSAAYLKNWLENLKEDATYIRTILTDVKRAAKMLETRINEVAAALPANDFSKITFDKAHIHNR